MNTNKKISLIALVLIIIAAGGYFAMSGSSDKRLIESKVEEQEQGLDPISEDEEASTPPEVADATVANPFVATTNYDDEGAREAFIESSLQKIPENERESLLFFADTLSDFTTEQASMGQLVERLKAKNIDPFVMKDENAYTGSMEVVRTQKVIPGTRYFHAQYFSDGSSESREKTLQHMSFEFRPGENSFDGVKAAFMKAFGLTGRPVLEKNGFVSWRKGPYTLWINTQSKEDMANDPFNAYDDNDIGTIRAAVELEIHDHQAPIFHAPLEEE